MHAVHLRTPEGIVWIESAREAVIKLGCFAENGRAIDASAEVSELLSWLASQVESSSGVF